MNRRQRQGVSAKRKVGDRTYRVSRDISEIASFGRNEATAAANLYQNGSRIIISIDGINRELSIKTSDVVDDIKLAEVRNGVLNLEYTVKEE